MSKREIISTNDAPAAVGPYCQAVKTGTTVYLSGQIPLDPKTMEVVEGDFKARATRCFMSLEAVAKAAGGSLNDAVKINIYLTDLSNFAAVNEVMIEFIDGPITARAAVQVAALPKGVDVEVDGILELNA